MALVVVHRPADEFMAQSIKDLLEQNGIPAMMHSFQIPAYDGIARMMRPSWGEVLVEKENLERATELVRGFLTEDSDEPQRHQDTKDQEIEDQAPGTQNRE